MRAELTANHMMNSLIPITRFNRGEANKIFDEVNANGEKIVFKNNIPICVLMDPSRYTEIMDALEDYTLLFEAEKRMAKAHNNYIPEDEVLSRLGISKADFDDVEVEIE